MDTARRAARALRAWLLAAPLLVAGCSSAPVRVYTHPEADMSYYARVGVVPFKSLTADALAGQKFSGEFTTALLAAGMFEVVDPGVFSTALSQVTGSRSPEDVLTLDQLKKIAEIAGVQGIFVGTVSQYEMMATSSGSFPVITVEARLIDLATGTVVWKSSVADRGGPKTPVIGVGEIHTLGGLAQELGRRMVAKLK
jgi:hypothetical protein